MKSRVGAIFGVLLFALSTNAGILKFSYKYAAKPVAKVAYKGALKPAAKVGSYPLRHPVKSSHAIKKVVF